MRLDISWHRYEISERVKGDVEDIPCFASSVKPVLSGRGLAKTMAKTSDDCIRLGANNPRKCVKKRKPMIENCV